MLNHAVGSGTHNHKDRGHDLYETPPCAVEALLKVETLPKRIWEPACGPGSISRVLTKHGHSVLSSDIVDYGQHYTKRDFLACTEPTDRTIITNPPYLLAEKFVRRALQLSPQVYMLLRLAFLESQRRSDILENTGLIRIHVFRNRLPMMHRDGWTGKKASSALAFAWFVWERGYRGPTVIDRISWE